MVKRETFNKIRELTGQIDTNLSEQDGLSRDDLRYWELQRENRSLLRVCKDLVLEG